MNNYNNTQIIMNKVNNQNKVNNAHSKINKNKTSSNKMNNSKINKKIKKNNLVSLLLMLFILLVFNSSLKQAHALEYYTMPNTIYHNTVMMLKIVNNENIEKEVSIESYVINNNKKKYYSKSEIKLSPGNVKILAKYIQITKDDNFMIYSITGDDKKTIKIPILYTINTGNTDLNINPQINITKSETTKKSNLTLNQNKAIQNSKSKSKITKKYDCSGSVFLLTPKKGVTNTFYDNEKIYLENTIEDNIKAINTVWKLTKTTDSLYTLNFPYSDKKPYYNSLIVYFEHCPEKKIEFYVKERKTDITMLYIAIILSMLVIFIAYYTELSIIDKKKTDERIKRMKEREKRLKQKRIKKQNEMKKNKENMNSKKKIKKKTQNHKTKKRNKNKKKN